MASFDSTIRVSGGKGPDGKALAVFIAEKAMKNAAGAGVRVGVLSNAPHDPGQRGGAPINMADLAAIHEFGLGVPERSFLRTGIAQAAPKVRGFLKRIKAPTLADPAALERVLAQIGLYTVAQIQSKFTDGSMTPLAPATIAAKGSSATLIDTGQLRAAVQYQVEIPAAGVGGR